MTYLTCKNSISNLNISKNILPEENYNAMRNVIKNKTLFFFFNAALLTVTSLIMRTVGVAFNVYVTGKLGASGVGLLSLITSAYGFFTTFALSGVNLAASRIVAEGLGHENQAEIRGGMKRCLIYSFCFGSVGTLAMFFSAEAIGNLVIADPRSVRSLRILAPSLLPLAMSSGIYGYLHAVRRVIKSASAQIAEQVIRIVVTVLALRAMLPGGLEYACFAVTLGITISEMAAFLYNIVIYRTDMKKHCSEKGIEPAGLTKKMLGISLPMALSSYMRSGLLTLEHMLIPIGLRKSGTSGETAIAEYGVLHGMAFPVVLYPQVLLQSISGLLVPEVAEEAARGNKETINSIAGRIIHMTLLFSVGTAGIMICFSSALGRTLYGNDEAGMFIRAIAPLIPVMYLDSAVDGLLKGLGEQLYSMRVNILDSTLSVAMVWFLLPKYGVWGYVLTVYACEIINGVLSLCRLLKVTAPGISIVRSLIMPLCCTVICCSFSSKIIPLLPDFISGGTAGLIISFFISALIYFILLTVCGCVKFSASKSKRKSGINTYGTVLNKRKKEAAKIKI